MKVYIMMFAIANSVSGGPIYNRNKIKYLEEAGWNVIVFPIDKGNVYVKGLEKYSNYYYPFISEFPTVFSKKQRNILLNYMISRIPKENLEKVVIETGTDFTSYWGELLAEKLNAKHFVFHLDEVNERITDKFMQYYKFKYERHELACISEEAMTILFKNEKEFEKKKMYALKACCHNVIENYENDMFTNINFSKYDRVIGHIGRLDKEYVPSVILDVKKYVMKQDKGFLMIFFGGGSDNIINDIRKSFESLKNIDILITDYIFPIPYNIVKKVDLFISAAGSSKATASLGIPTIRINVYSGKPVGFVIDANKLLLKEINGEQILEKYLDEFFNKGFKLDIKSQDIDSLWKDICCDFDKHMDFINHSETNKSYYSFETIKLSKKQFIKKCILFIVGIKKFYVLKRKIKRC